MRTSIFEGRGSIFFLLAPYSNRSDLDNKKKNTWIGNKKTRVTGQVHLCYSEVAIHYNRQVSKIVKLIFVKTIRLVS